MKVLFFSLLLPLYMLCIYFCIMLLELTHVKASLFFGVIAVLALIISIPAGKLVKCFTGWHHYLSSFMVSAVTIFMLVSTGVLSGNYYFASSSTHRRVVIERRVEETHYRSRRVSRKVYTRGAPYQVYYFIIKAEGECIKVKVDKKVYDSARKGDHAEMVMKKGYFSMPVFCPNTLRLESPRPVNNHRRCKFFGTTGI